MNAKKTLSALITLIFRAIALAMAVAALVLNLLGVISIERIVMFLSVGLISLAVSSFSQQKDIENDDQDSN